MILQHHEFAQPQKPVSNLQTDASIPLFSVDEADLFNFSDEVSLVCRHGSSSARKQSFVTVELCVCVCVCVCLCVCSKFVAIIQETLLCKVLMSIT